MDTANQSIRIEDIISKTSRARETASKNIGSIRKVTEQLRILAMNAMIEATRAGDLGRGFSVVAEEVKQVSVAVNQFSDELDKELGGEMQTLERLASNMAETANGTRLIDLSLNAVELIDRNLFERTCDVRWWATDSAVVDATAEPTPENTSYANERLGVILGAYTVYLDLWLCDLDGKIIANGRPNQYNVIGRSVAEKEWFNQGAILADGDSYVVAPVATEPLLGSAQIATYVASVRENGRMDGNQQGVLAIHFDWEPQADAIVQGVRLSDEERERTRVLLTDSHGQVIASSNGKGTLRERIDFDFQGRTSGYERRENGDRIAFHKTPGYETYEGLGWYGVIIQSP